MTKLLWSTIAVTLFAMIPAASKLPSPILGAKSDNESEIHLVEPIRKLNSKISNPRLESDKDSTPSVRAVRVMCYSCMSNEFEKYWHILQHIYEQPKNFTDSCLDLPRRTAIGVVLCETACLTTVERKISGGVFVYNVVRGCLSSVYKSNMESKKPKPHEAASLKHASSSSRRSLCNEIYAGNLLPQSGVPSLSSEESIGHRLTTCICYGNLCNNQPFANLSTGE